MLTNGIHQTSNGLVQKAIYETICSGGDLLVINEVDPASAPAQKCLDAYYEELTCRLNGQYNVALSRVPANEDMQRPRGMFLVATISGLSVGCAGLSGTDKGYAEVKRVWVSPQFRRCRICSMMLQCLELSARRLGYKLLRLDTNSVLHEAIALYSRSGWHQIERFSKDPYPDHFFKKLLDQ